MNNDEKKTLESKRKSIIEYSKYVNNHISHVHIAFVTLGAKICHDLEDKYRGLTGLHAQVRKRIMMDTWFCLLERLIRF